MCTFNHTGPGNPGARRWNVLLDIKTRLVLAGAVLGASLVTAAAVEPQVDTSSGVTTTDENVSPTTHTAPPVAGTLPTPQNPPTDPNTNAATGGSGLVEDPGTIRGSDLAPSPSTNPGTGTRRVGEANSTTQPPPNYSPPTPER